MNKYLRVIGSIILLTTLGYFCIRNSEAQEPSILFQNSFENNSIGWTAFKGQATYPTIDCHSSRCGQMTLRAGITQQSVFWEKSLNYSGQFFYAAAWFKFPVGYSWDPAPGFNSTEHKLFIVNTVDSVGRILLNLRGGGLSPELQIHFERLDNSGGISNFTGTHWPADGKWHYLELLVKRQSGDAGGAAVYLDGRNIFEKFGAVCGYPCSPVNGIQVGAFVNQGATKAQSFFVDDVILATGRQYDPVITVPPVVVAPNNTEAIDAIDRAINELNKAKEALK